MKDKQETSNRSGIENFCEFKEKFKSNLKKIDDAVETMRQKYSSEILELYKYFHKYPYTLFISKIESDRVYMMTDLKITYFDPYKVNPLNKYIGDGLVDLEFCLMIVDEGQRSKYAKMKKPDKRNKYLSGKLPYIGNIDSDAYDARTYFTASKFFKVLDVDGDDKNTLGYIHYDILPFDDYDSAQLYLETRNKDGGQDGK